MITETVAAGNANTAAERCMAPPPSEPYRQSLVNKLARRVHETPGMQAVVIGDLHINHYKNFRTAVAAAYATSGRLQQAFDFVAFGGGPISATELTWFRECGLRADAIVQMFGNDAYRHAPAFVYPSLYEGFGIPPPEAITSGCLVACADRSSIPEVVGQAALRFDPEDIHAVSVALECIAFDDDLHARLRIADQGHAQRFPWDRCAAETVAVYRPLLPA